MRILLTGATGVLGSALLPQLNDAGHTVRGLSRRARPAESAAAEWATADLVGGELAPAVADVDAIIHAASNPPQGSHEVDVNGTARLLAAARDAGVGHVVYISIVGIDKIPLGYYKVKLAAEAAVQAGGVPWTILRATQFYDLIDGLLTSFARVPLVMPMPAGFLFQPVAAAEVAAELVKALDAGPAGAVPDFAGPEQQDIRVLAERWLAATGRRRLIVPLPLPGAIAAGYRAGYNTAPVGRRGQLTWAQWLAHRYGPSQ